MLKATWSSAPRAPTGAWLKQATYLTCELTVGSALTDGFIGVHFPFDSSVFSANIPATVWMGLPSIKVPGKSCQVFKGEKQRQSCTIPTGKEENSPDVPTALEQKLANGHQEPRSRGGKQGRARTARRGQQTLR